MPATPVILADQFGNAWALTVDGSTGAMNLAPSHGTPVPAGANSITVSAFDIIEAALMEIGVIAAGEPVSLADSAWVLQKLQRLVDRYNARLPMVYNVNFGRFTIPTNTQPITIGPNGANFDVNQRPQSIESVSLILTTPSNTQVELPLNKRDQDWWANNRVKTLKSNIPTDFYYSPDWPNGSLYLWPIPTAANDLRIQTRLILAQFTQYTDQFSMPPAYWDAIVYPLAISLCPSYERTASAELIQLSRESIKAIQVNNIASPRGVTGDAGMPGVGKHGNFNYVSGMPK
jgi:hypothetical protein